MMRKSTRRLILVIRSRALSNEWDQVKTNVGHAEAPSISGALAHVECAPFANYDGGDHAIFVVPVVCHATHPDAPASLMFLRGRYRDLVNETQRAPAWPLPIDYSFQTGETRVRSAVEHLSSLRDDCTIFTNGGRVADVTTHHAFRNVAGSMAGLFDFACA
jgi:Flavin reductase like domain